MTKPPDTAQIRALVEGEWSLPGATVTEHHGGMNSATWFVTRGTERWVAKAADVGAGYAVAEAVQRAGIPTGAPVRPITHVNDMPVALLAYVPGRPLTANDQPLIGTTLAAVHKALRNVTVPGERPFFEIDPSADHFDVRPSLRPAVQEAVDALGTGWTTGLLHLDPDPGSFLHSDHTALIDWGDAIRGPLLYDLASAVMYADRGVVAPYVAAGVLTEAEVAEGLDRLLRFRYAIQADYFCRRTATNDLTGIPGPEGNATGLADAERLLLQQTP